MAKQKLHIGDRVKLTDRAPAYMFTDLNINKPRKIQSTEYDPILQATVYYLSSNKTLKSDTVANYPFRSYQLSLFKGFQKAGRPITHRRYRKPSGGRLRA